MNVTPPVPSFAPSRARRARLPIALAAALLVAGGALAAAPAPAAADGERRAVPRSGSSSSTSSSSSARSGSSSRSQAAPRSSASSEERHAVPRSDGEALGERRYGGDRGRIRAERHRRGGVVLRFGGHSGWWYPYFGVWAGPWYGWYDGWYGRGGVYGGWGYPHRDGAAGALDLDISPEKAEIWLDGEYIGVADHFDGWPGYLWLPRGTYDLVFYKEGYETIARQYTVRPGVVIDVEDEMRRGESIPPEELVPARGERRDERLRRRTERAERSEAPDWRERVRRERERREQSERGDDERDEDERGDDERDERWDEDGNRERVPRAPYDARGEAARLVLEVEPDDAAVYLDGRFLGIARDLPREVLVEPGRHEVAVVRPGYGSVTEEVEVEAGDRTELEIDLD